MINKQLIAKIILNTTGNVHIMMNNYLSVFATIENVISLISDPYSFIEEGYKKYELSEKELRGVSRRLLDYQGVALVNIYDDSSSEIVYPILFDHLKLLNNSNVNEKINLLYLKDKERFRDRKELFLKLYLDTVDVGPKKYVVERNTTGNSLDLNESIGQMVSLVSSCEGEEKELRNINSNKVDSVSSKIVTNNLITAKEYCDLYNIKYGTFAVQLRRGQYSSAIKHNGMWYIDKLEPYAKSTRVKKAEPHFSKVKLDTYEDVQKYLKEKGYFTDRVRKYIRNYKEAVFYRDNHYHEVSWNNKPALILDIKPEFYCKELEMTNRELILSGRSPVVPNEYLDDGKTPAKWHLHHIGQMGSEIENDSGYGWDKNDKKSSPFRIINEKIHISKEYFSIFHGTKTTNEDLHGKSFELEKRSFWLIYLEEYDNAGDYYKIPYFNSMYKLYNKKESRNEQKNKIK